MSTSISIVHSSFTSASFHQQTSTIHQQTPVVSSTSHSSTASGSIRTTSVPAGPQTGATFAAASVRRSTDDQATSASRVNGIRGGSSGNIPVHSSVKFDSFTSVVLTLQPKMGEQASSHDQASVRSTRPTHATSVTDSPVPRVQIPTQVTTHSSTVNILGSSLTPHKSTSRDIPTRTHLGEGVQHTRPSLVVQTISSISVIDETSIVAVSTAHSVKVIIESVPITASPSVITVTFSASSLPNPSQTATASTFFTSGPGPPTSSSASAKPSAPHSSGLSKWHDKGALIGFIAFFSLIVTSGALYVSLGFWRSRRKKRIEDNAEEVLAEVAAGVDNVPRAPFFAADFMSSQAALTGNGRRMSIGQASTHDLLPFAAVEGPEPGKFIRYAPPPVGGEAVSSSANAGAYYSTSTRPIAGPSTVPSVYSNDSRSSTNTVVPNPGFGPPDSPPPISIPYPAPHRLPTPHLKGILSRRGSILPNEEGGMSVQAQPTLPLFPQPIPELQPQSSTLRPPILRGESHASSTSVSLGGGSVSSGEWSPDAEGVGSMLRNRVRRVNGGAERWMGGDLGEPGRFENGITAGSSAGLPAPDPRGGEDIPSTSGASLYDESDIGNATIRGWT